MFSPSVRGESREPGARCGILSDPDGTSRLKDTRHQKQRKRWPGLPGKHTFSAMERMNVYIDPDGSIDTGLLVLVAAPTGVVYETQCAGLRCEQRGLEGYIVPCSSQSYELTSNVAADIADFFYRHFKNQGDSADTWPSKAVAELSTLIHSVAFWTTPKDAPHRRERLRLDHTRLEECTEAWIPIITPYGPGVLIFKNSD